MNIIDINKRFRSETHLWMRSKTGAMPRKPSDLKDLEIVAKEEQSNWKYELNMSCLFILIAKNNFTTY